MRHYIVFTGAYLPTPSANGVCLDELLKDLGKRGFFAHVISIAPTAVPFENSYCKVYPVFKKVITSSTTKLELFQIKLERLKNYPLDNKGVQRRVMRLAREIAEAYTLEFAFCNQLPESSGFYALKLKEVVPSLKIMLYELDSLTDNSNNTIGIKRFFAKRNDRLERTIYDKADLIIHIKSHADYYEQPKYDRYRCKSICVEWPLINQDIYGSSHEVEPHGVFNMIYSGVLMRDFRSPEYLVSLLEELVHQEYNIKIDFFSRGDCEEYLQRIGETDMKGVVFANGYIAKVDLDARSASADVLVSIGNNFKGEVLAAPSKTLYYISLGKPVIHIAPDHKDMALDYLEKYPGSLIIFETDDFSENVKKLKSFLDNIDGKLVPYDTIQSAFKENTGKHTVDEILQRL